MDYDFIEIGTSNHETLIEVATDTMIGLSVEPVKKYLDMLPDKPNVRKINAAITSGRTSESVDLYYIPDEVVDEHGWPQWLKGCNCINSYHGQHYGRTEYVKTMRVPLLNIDELLTQNNVRHIKYLKIDTEGHDCVILNGLFDYLVTKNKAYYPSKIEFETNLWTKQEIVDKTIDQYIRLGYVVVSRGHDTVLQFNPQLAPQLKMYNGKFILTH